MGQKLSIIQKYFIENHKDKMTVEQLAKTVGCTTRTIYNHIKADKPGRTSEEYAEHKGNSPPADPKPMPVPGIPGGSVEEAGVDVKKHGTGGAVAMTSAGSQVIDELSKVSKTEYPSYVHIIPKKQ